VLEVLLALAPLVADAGPPAPDPSPLLVAELLDGPPAHLWTSGTSAAAAAVPPAAAWCAHCRAEAPRASFPARMPAVPVLPASSPTVLHRPGSAQHHLDAHSQRASQHLARSLCRAPHSVVIDVGVRSCREAGERASKDRLLQLRFKVLQRFAAAPQSSASLLSWAAAPGAPAGAGELRAWPGMYCPAAALSALASSLKETRFARR
jgi:hypothetical protein